MNFNKGLIFTNKEAVKRALTIYAAKLSRYFMTSRSTKSKLCVKCMDESCKWYIRAVMKPKLNGPWMLTSYMGPHNSIPLAMPKDGRMINSNFVAAELIPTLQQNHVVKIDHLRDIIKVKYYDHKLSYYKVWDAKQKAIAKIFGNWE